MYIHIYTYIGLRVNPARNGCMIRISTTRAKSESRCELAFARYCFTSKLV